MGMAARRRGSCQLDTPGIPCATWVAIRRDEPASELLKRVADERKALVKAGKLKAGKADSVIFRSSDRLAYETRSGETVCIQDEIPFEIPDGWAWARLGDLMIVVATGPFGSMLHKTDYVSGGIPLINPINMQDGKIAPSEKMLVSPSAASRLSQYKLSKGMIVVARRGELGRCAVVGEEEAGWLCGTGSFFLKPYDLLHIPYLTMLISSPYARKVFTDNSIGTTMTNLNHGLLRNLLLPLPPLAEQKRIVAKVEELFKVTCSLKDFSRP